MNRAIVFFLAAATLLAADWAVAQIPGDQDWKIGPFIAGQRLRASDTVQIPLGYHHTQPSPFYAGWAGYKFTVHVLDNTELDVDAVTPYPYINPDPPVNGPIQVAGEPTTNPFGPRSQNVVSVPREWKVVHPAAPNSGIFVNASDSYRVADLKLHIKGTNNPAQNSDTDAVVQLWNIWHFREGYTSINVPLRPSDRVWVGSDNQVFHRTDSAYEIPPTIPQPPLSSPDGHWLHITQPMQFHFYGSQFYATLADTITIGIEHIPEPVTGVLLGLGVLCAAMGMRSYRKSRS